MAQDFVGWILITLTLLRKGAAVLEPSFDVPVINITVVVGKTAILPCSVENLEDHKVVWTDEFSTLLTFDNNRIIDDDRIGIDRPYERDWNLIIHDVRVKDRGRYICQINTDPIKTKPVDLYVLVPPQILNKNEDGKGGEIITREGETVNVVCNVSGIPAPSVKWYRRPLTDTSGSKRERIGMEGEILVIHNISRYCDGVYQCVASNDVPPAVEMETTVTVEFQPEVHLMNHRQSQERGKGTVLWCEVTAFPQTLSYWRYHGDEVVNSPRLKVDIYPKGKPHTNVLSLQITNISEVDYGEYECYASNKLGQDREAMILSEELRPPPKQTARQTPSVVYPTTTKGRHIVMSPVTYKPHTTSRNDPVKPGKTSFVSNQENGCQCLHKNVFVIIVTFFVSLIS